MDTQKEAAQREGKEVRRNFADRYMFRLTRERQIENEKALAEAALSVLKNRNEDVS